MTTADTVLFTGTDTTTPVSYTGKEFRLGVGGVLMRKDAASGLQARSGVLSADSLAVSQTPTASMSTVYAAGIAALQGTVSGTQGLYVAVWLAPGTLTHQTSDPGADRLDLVQMRVYDVDDGVVVAGGPHYGAEITIKEGVASGTPVLPAPDTDAFGIASVSVGAGVSQITDADITDLRPRAVALGGILPCTSTTRPGHDAGLAIYETDTGRAYISTGTAWAALNPGSGAVSASVSTDQSTSSTSYVDLATVGPSVTVHLEAGQNARVAWHANIFSATQGDRSFMSYAVSGASTVAAADTKAVKYRAANVNNDSTESSSDLYTATASGSHTFTLKYRFDSGTGPMHFVTRYIEVVPL